MTSMMSYLVTKSFRASAVAALALAGMLFLAGPVGAQTPVRVESTAPDCNFYFTFTGAASSVSFDNRQRACANWIVSYSNTGFAALTLTFQEAPDAAGAPGAWGAFAGTTILGANPMVSITQTASTFFGYAAWVRVTVAGLGGAGTIRGRVYGIRAAPAVTLLGAATSTVTAIGPDAPGAASTQSPVQVAGNDGAFVRAITTDSSGRTMAVGAGVAGAALVGNPVQVGGSDGTNTRRLLTDAAGSVRTVGGCTQQAVITIAGAGDTQIVAAPGAGQIHICHISVSWTGAVGVDFQLIQGTGANCVVGTANVTGNYQNVVGIALDYHGTVRANAVQALCVRQVGAVAAGGVITYGVL